MLLTGTSLAGYLLVVYSTAIAGVSAHFDLFGIRHVYLYLSNQKYTHLPFFTEGLYGFVRHPLYVGWIIAFWATPKMTLGHFLMAGTWTAYMVLAVYHFEEPDLESHFGKKYVEYRKNVPAFVPSLRKK